MSSSPPPAGREGLRFHAMLGMLLVTSERCSACGVCVPRCPFGALRRVSRRELALDRAGCWGCGTCRSACARDAIRLEPRAAAPGVASLW